MTTKNRYFFRSFLLEIHTYVRSIGNMVVVVSKKHFLAFTLEVLDELALPYPILILFLVYFLVIMSLYIYAHRNVNNCSFLAMAFSG